LVIIYLTQDKLFISACAEALINWRQTICIK
jgi:hypothetical protein